MSFGVVGEYAKNLIAKKIVIYIYYIYVYKKKPLYAYTETALNGCLGCPV